MEKFLRLAEDAVEMREPAIQADDNYFLFNQGQCRRLWQNLSAASSAFAPSLSYSPQAQQKCLPLHKEFYNIVLRADEIAGKCSDKQSWLKEAIFLGGNRQVFQELSADLQSCIHNFHRLTQSLCLDSQIPAPSRVIHIAIPEGELDEDHHKDFTSLMSRLEEREVDFGEEEKRLASYIVERGIIHRVPEPEPDNLDPAKPKKPLFYEVHREDPVHVGNLGSGASGIVSEVKWLGLTCAKKEFLNMESTVKDLFEKEVGALAALSHSRTVKLLCSNGKVPNPYFIMEFMPMTLEKFCKRKDASVSMRFEILPSINMMLQISSGMEYLHDNGVVHRDLKSANILVRESHHLGLRSEGYVDVKLTDFGLAKMKVPDESMEATGRMGTSQWSAPEVLGIPPCPPEHQSAIPPNPPKPRIDWRRADTYSFAVVCSEILTGQRPYSEIWSGTRSVASVISGELRPKLPEDCPTYLSEFLSQCWAHNPKDRPTFKEITQTLSEFKTCLQIGIVPELTRVRKVPFFMGLMTSLGVRKNESYVRPQLRWCPDPTEKNRFEAAVNCIYDRMEMMEALCGEMKEHLKMVEICHVQCDHLVRSYLEGFQKVEAMLKLVSPVDFWNLHTSEKLKKFSQSMETLICSTMAVVEIVRACGGSEWMITALTIFEARGYCSIFGLRLWDLYWNLFVIDHAMHDVTARQSRTSLQLLSTSSTVRILWCKKRRKLVLQKVTSTGHEDGDGEFLRADADRQAEDRKNLILRLSHVVNDSLVSGFAFLCSCFLPPEVPLKTGAAVFLRNRLESTTDRLDLDSYKIDDLKPEAGVVIGRGSSKVVRRQKWCGESVAVSTTETGFRGGDFMTEVSMYANLQHSNVVHLVGWKIDDKYGHIAMELMEQDLEHLIERNSRLYRGSPFSLLVAIDMLLQVVEAMIHIHECGVIYRDLKPRNILVRPKYTAKSHAQELDVYYTVKLTDFETARLMRKSSSTNHTVDCGPEAFEMPVGSELMTERVGTKCYMAPEVMHVNRDVGYTYSVDIYSFGMTAYQVTTGKRPEIGYPNILSYNIFRERVLQGGRPRFRADFSSWGLKELIEKCWAGVPEERPSFEQIRKDLWTLKCHESIAR